MKKIISAIVIAAMLLSTVIMAFPIGAAENSTTVTTADEFYQALKKAKGNYTINVEGTIELDKAMPAYNNDANITVTGDTLVLSKLKTVNLWYNITFKNITLQLANDGTLYANGYDLTIDSDVTVKYATHNNDSTVTEKTGSAIRFTVYGGGCGTVINGDTNIRILSGIYSKIYGGSNGGLIVGDTNVTIGTGTSLVNNDTLVGWDDKTHGSTYQFFGGSNGGGEITGDTHLTVGNKAYADYAVAGNNGGGLIGGTAYMDFSGYAYGLYGGSRSGNTMNDVCLTMTGGGVADICGGSADVNLGSESDPSNVVVKFLGGELTRRIYGGCYNNDYDGAEADAHYVYGTITLIIGGNPTFSFDHKIDYDVPIIGTTTVNGSEGIFASSRQEHNSAKEEGRIIFLDKDFSSYIGGKNGLGYGNNPSTKHKFTYSVDGNKLTETCSCGCGHTSTSTLTLTSSQQFYTGSAIECGVLTYGTNWMSGPIDGVNYQDNVNKGTATASMTLKMVDDYTVSSNFTIIKAPNTTVQGSETEDGVDLGFSANVEVNYNVENTYTLVIPAAIALGAKGAEIGTDVGVEDMVIPVEHELYMKVSSQNGFKVKYGDASIAYSMKYGDATVTDGTEENEILAAAWNVSDNKALVHLGFTRLEDHEGTAAAEYTDRLCFTTSVKSTGKIPLVDGKEFTTSGYDQGQGSELYVANNVESLDVYNSYLRDIEDAGYEFYTSNVIADNHFATFTGQGKILNIIYAPYYKEIRVVTDLESEFGLPGLASENIYATLENYIPSLTLVSNYQMGWPGRMGYVYQLADGSFFVIDGGYTVGKNDSEHKVTTPQITCGGKSSAPYLIEILEEYAPDKNNIVIAAWFITHMHEDHFGAFIDIANLSEYKYARDKITIEQLIYNQSSMDDVRKTDDYKSATYTENEAITLVFNYAIDQWGDKIQSKVKAHPGQQFFLRNLTLTIWTSQDFLHAASYVDPWITGSNADGSNTKYINNTSIVTQVDFCGKKALFLADSSAANNPYVVKPLFEKALREMQIVQVAHHGYSDTDVESVYKCLDSLELVIWSSNAEHFYGKEIGYIEGGKLYGGTMNVGPNQPLFKEGVKHYIHGKYNLVITDFVNYTPESVPDELQIYDRGTWVPDMHYITKHGY